MALCQSLQNCVNGGAGDLRLYSAQHVVGAYFKDHRFRTLAHRPIEPRQHIGGGVAGDTRIDHFGGEPFCGERRLKPRHEALAKRQAEPRRQRIASATTLTGLAAVTASAGASIEPAISAKLQAAACST